MDHIRLTQFRFSILRGGASLQIERGRIWSFEQEQALGFSSVTTNIRMTVIKLQSGGLWVHAPIGPTDECIQVLPTSQTSKFI